MALAQGNMPESSSGIAGSSFNNDDASFTFAPAPSISVPSGGGTLRGMGDSFSINNATGTGSYSIPLSVSPGRAGAETSLSLHYSTGGGNGAFGLGWSHSFELSVSRKTNPSLPKYLDDEDSDTFLISGHGELVRCCDTSGEPVLIAADDDYIVKQYRPRLERSFGRIELWAKKDDPHDTHWRTFSGDNELAIFGRNEGSRIFTRDGSRLKIFSWLLSEQYDCRGNARQFVYKAEDGANVHVDQACETHRSGLVRSSMRYLKSIRYGNRQPHEFATLNTANDSKFMFEIVFDYGEHHSLNPTTEEIQPWPVRQDPFSSYRSGFDIRSYRICRRVLMFHHIPEELGRADYLVASTNLTYDDSKHAGHLLSIQHFGYLAKGPSLSQLDDASPQYFIQNLPPLQLEYTAGLSPEQLRDAPVQFQNDAETFANIPAAGARTMSWIDLLGEGVPGVLASEGGEWFYKQNLSPAVNDFTSARDRSRQPRLHLNPLADVSSRPSQRGQGTALIDVGANGSLDLVCQNSSVHGFFRANTVSSVDNDDKIAWEDYQAFSSVLNIDTANFVRFLDMTGDGTADALVYANNQLVWFPSLGEKGYGPAATVTIGTGLATATGLLFFQDPQCMHLADMSGDGLSDIVSVRNGAVSYWPNCGNGSFGDMITMDFSPIFDDDVSFSSEKLFLCDIDGSGTTDLVYNRNGTVSVYLNSSGNGFEERITLSTQIPQTQNHSVSVVDIFGNGTACLVWSSDLPSQQGRESLQYIDLTNGVKPHLLCRISNGMGSLTELVYAPSTSYYLKDKLNGRPWVTKLPSPVHCVDSVAKHDLITGRKFIQRFAYHHGAYDHIECEFAGFALVEQWDTERSELMGDSKDADNCVAGLDSRPAHVKSWYHTGIFADHDRLSRKLSEEYYGSDGTGRFYDSLPNNTIICHVGDLTVEEAQQASYALRGTLLRMELSADDPGSTKAVPYQIMDHGSDVEVLQPCVRAGTRAVIFKSERETIEAILEQQTEFSARRSHNMILERDRFGRATKEVRIQYGRRDVDSTLSPLDQSIQAKTEVQYKETLFTNSVDIPGKAYRLPLPSRVQSWDVEGLHTSLDRFEPSEILAATSKRLTSHSEIRHRKNDLTALSEELESLAIPGAVFRLCITKQMLHNFRARDSTAEVSAPATSQYYSLLISDGGYVDLNKDGNLWIRQAAPSFHPDTDVTPANELRLAQSSFFSIQRVTDNFGNPTTVRWDPYFLAPNTTKDALGNSTVGRVDYRVMQMDLIVDLNGNRKSVVFDALGAVTALAISGKDGEGDSIDGLATETTTDQMEAFFRDPNILAPSLLGHASTRFINDPWAFTHNGRRSPVRQARISRVKHSSESSESPVAIQVEYMDGFGRSIQTKVNAEPAQGSSETSRWRCTAWQVVNNKGLPVERFEPFFDDSAAFVLGRKEGVSTLHAYDPLGREVVTIFPNGTWTKQVASPWHGVLYDASDTLETPLDRDPWAMKFVGSLSQASYSPSWLEQRMALPDGSRDKQAAVQSKAYGCTPNSTYIDSRSRPFLQQKTLTNKQTIFVRKVLDTNDRPLEIQDAGDRLVNTAVYDLLGQQLYQNSIDSGEQWILYTSAGEILQQFNSRGYTMRHTFDALRRNVATYCRNTRTSSPEFMITKTIYGDSEADNSKGQITQQMDQSGVTSTPFWDFKGNCLSKEVHLAKDYSHDIDWQKYVALEDFKYTSADRYDALNRVTSSIAPDGTVTKSTYFPNGLIDSVFVNIRSEKDASGWKWKRVSSNKQYDACGRLISEVQGNGMLIKVEIDVLSQQISRRQVFANNVAVQDIKYTRDVNHDVIYTSRSSQSAEIARLDGNADLAYEYDALRRLIKASGREDVGQTGGRPDSPGNSSSRQDSTSMKSYTETYNYDCYNNMTVLDHRFDDARYSGWSRKMTYSTQSMGGKSVTGNRLVESSMGRVTERYSYDEGGNMVSMPHLTKVEWDACNQMRSSSTQLTSAGTPETTWYVYNSAGDRVRKVTERYRRAGENSRKSSEHTYIDEFDVYQEYTGQYQVSKTCESVRVGESGDPIVVIENWSDRSVPLMRYQIKDDHESISLELDDTCQEISYEEYSAFGSTTYSRSQRDAPKPFRYAIKRRDKQTGLYYFGGRYYAAWLCRWMSPDPSGLVDGVNTYVYCAANPTNHTDQDGNMLARAGFRTINGAAHSTAIRPKPVNTQPHRVPYTSSASPAPRPISSTHSGLLSTSPINAAVQETGSTSLARSFSTGRSTRDMVIREQSSSTGSFSSFSGSSGGRSDSYGGSGDSTAPSSPNFSNVAKDKNDSMKWALHAATTAVTLAIDILSVSHEEGGVEKEKPLLTWELVSTQAISILFSKVGMAWRATGWMANFVKPAVLSIGETAVHWGKDEFVGPDISGDSETRGQFQDALAINDIRKAILANNRDATKQKAIAFVFGVLTGKFIEHVQASKTPVKDKPVSMVKYEH